jgi:hypothetical protein
MTFRVSFTRIRYEWQQRFHARLPLVAIGPQNGRLTHKKWPTGLWADLRTATTLWVVTIKLFGCL